MNEKELVTAARAKVTVFDNFLQFLIIGATSFGGVVPYLREGLITAELIESAGTQLAAQRPPD